MIQKTLTYILTLVLFLTLTHELTYAQKAAVRKNTRIADDYYERLDLLKAYDLYKEIISVDTSDMRVYYRAGICLFTLNKIDSLTLYYFQKSSSKILESHYYMGRIYHMQNNLHDAINEFIFLKDKYEVDLEITIEEVESWIGICKRSIEQSLNKQDISLKNLGPGINTQYAEYAPVLPNDERSLIFTSRREGSTGGEKDPYNNFYEDIYTSTKTDTVWSKASPLSNKINTNTHDASVSFTPDNSALIIYRTDEKKTGGDLYTSSRKENDWEQPVLLSSKINSEYCEASAAFSPDDDIVIFSSNKPEGMGGKDLYRIRKFSDGTYSSPLNLGPAINTPNDEDAPFIHPNGKTLFFSSKGHNTVGGYDIFESELIDSSLMWGTPNNMGIPLNSTSDDINYIVTKNGEKGFLASSRPGGYGSFDIYETPIRSYNQIYTVVKGQIIIEEDKKVDLSKVEITLIDVQTGKLNGIYKLKKNYSTFILVIEKTKEYKIIVDGPDIELLIEKKKIETDEINLQVKKASQ